MRRRVGWVLVVAVLAAGCTDYPGGAPRTEPSPSPARTPSTSVPTSPPPWVTDDPDTISTRPLVFAVDARRPPLDLTTEQADRLQRGAIHRWRQLGQPGGVLHQPELATPLHAVPHDAMALVVADAVTPGVRVATVEGIDPLRDPAAYPVQVQGPAPQPVTTLTVVGDVMLGRGVAGHPLAPMAARLASADLTVGNLESTLSDAGAPTQGGDSFHAPPSVRSDLRAAGFDALDLANNHAGDYGDRALVDTVRLLRRGGLPVFGAGRDLDEARGAAVLTRHGVRFGFLGFNAIGETPEAGPGQPGANAVSMPPRTGPLDRSELDRVLGDVRRLSRRVDVVVVMPHWGTQYTHRPEPVQHTVGRALARAGADLVVGGHPHWVQGAEEVGGTLVVHSLGNFVFDMDFSPQTMEGVVLEATFWGSRLMAADFVPYRMDERFAPHVLPFSAAGSVLDPFWAFSSLGRATR